MHRATASYKLMHGLGKTLKDKLKDKQRAGVFSLNLDEPTLNNSLHELTLLVSYYDPGQNDVVTDHLASVDVPSVDASSLFDKMKEIVKKCNLSFSKLLAVLMDSCSVMREEESGLETKIFEVVPHLIDVDRDSCHHIHNFMKKMTSHFGYYLEGLLRHVYHDFQHSASSLEILEGMALHYGLSFPRSYNYVVTRWFSVLDATNNDISELPKSELLKLQDKAAAKTANGTAKGKERKNRIIAKLFKQKAKASCHFLQGRIGYV